VSNLLILLKENAVALDSLFVSELLRAMCKMCGGEALLSQMIPVQFIVWPTLLSSNQYSAPFRHVLHGSLITSEHSRSAWRE